ncbi:hypothetical protein CLAIMM_08607 [Cladophialophora immunda]|nr:hypothetical protein CLAIMM_08607 [Cladophialophora immunda]
MRGIGGRLFGAHGHCLSAKITPQIPCLRSPICLVKHRAVSTRHGEKPLERIIPNPAASHYEDKPVYPEIPVQTCVPSTPISSCNLASTRPAKLATPEPLNQQDYNGPIPIGDWVRWYFRLGKSYLAFYKTGFRHTWQNYKELKKIRGRFGNRRLEDVVKYGGGGGGADQADGAPAPSITREEYQLALRARHDLGKLVPFAIVFAICGEFTPLVILAIGSAAVPYTCRIPKQEQNDFLRPARIRPKYTAQVDQLRGEGARTGADHVRWKLEFIEAYRLNVNPFLRPVPVLGSLWHTFYSGPRLRRHCEEVLCDTILIRREGGFDRLPPREVFQWSLKHGSRSLTEYIDNQRRRGLLVDPESPELKEMLLPVVEAEADYILGVDWRRLSPENHWLSVFRPTSVAPDDRHSTER